MYLPALPSFFTPSNSCRRRDCTHRTCSRRRLLQASARIDFPCSIILINWLQRSRPPFLEERLKGKNQGETNLYKVPHPSSISFHIFSWFPRTQQSVQATNNNRLTQARSSPNFQIVFLFNVVLYIEVSFTKEGNHKLPGLPAFVSRTTLSLLKRTKGKIYKLLRRAKRFAILLTFGLADKAREK